MMFQCMLKYRCISKSLSEEKSVSHDRPHIMSFDFCDISRVPKPSQIENASVDGTRLLTGERAQTVAVGLLFRALTTL